MFSRSIYGLTLTSPFDLPELLPASPQAAAGGGVVCVQFGRVTLNTPVLEEESCRFWAGGSAEAQLQYDGVGTFQVIGGQGIVIQPDTKADERELRFFLLGPAMAMLLHQRGLLVLHASTVRVGGVGVAITGFSGRGKSTLTAELCSRGHPLVSDDITPIDLSQGQPRALPGAGQVRLLPESLAVLGCGEYSKLPVLHPRTDKRGWCAAQTIPPDETASVARLYIITDADTIAIDPMPPHRAFGQLVSCTYPVAARLLDADGTARTHFAQCAALASQITVSKLKRPRALELLPKLAQAIEEDVVSAACA